MYYTVVINAIRNEYIYFISSRYVDEIGIDVFRESLKSNVYSQSHMITSTECETLYELLSEYNEFKKIKTHYRVIKRDAEFIGFKCRYFKPQQYN